VLSSRRCLKFGRYEFVRLYRFPYDHGVILIPHFSELRVGCRVKPTEILDGIFTISAPDKHFFPIRTAVFFTSCSGEKKDTLAGRTDPLEGSGSRATSLVSLTYRITEYFVYLNLTEDCWGQMWAYLCLIRFVLTIPNNSFIKHCNFRLYKVCDTKASTRPMKASVVPITEGSELPNLGLPRLRALNITIPLYFCENTASFGVRYLGFTTMNSFFLSIIGLEMSGGLCLPYWMLKGERVVSYFCMFTACADSHARRKHYHTLPDVIEKEVWSREYHMRAAVAAMRNKNMENFKAHACSTLRTEHWSGTLRTWTNFRST
jgi:hypothetical protein